MPRKDPDTRRWGGPGASHEDRTRRPPEPRVIPGPDRPTNRRFSQVSGGGGERDSRHSHDPELKGDFEQSRDEKKRPQSDESPAFRGDLDYVSGQGRKT